MRTWQGNFKESRRVFLRPQQCACKFSSFQQVRKDDTLLIPTVITLSVEGVWVKWDVFPQKPKCRQVLGPRTYREATQNGALDLVFWRNLQTNTSTFQDTYSVLSRENCWNLDPQGSSFCWACVIRLEKSLDAKQYDHRNQQAPKDQRHIYSSWLPYSTFYAPFCPQNQHQKWVCTSTSLTFSMKPWVVMEANVWGATKTRVNVVLAAACCAGWWPGVGACVALRILNHRVKSAWLLPQHSQWTCLRAPFTRNVWQIVNCSHRPWPKQEIASDFKLVESCSTKSANFCQILLNLKRFGKVEIQVVPQRRHVWLLPFGTGLPVSLGLHHANTTGSVITMRPFPSTFNPSLRVNSENSKSYQRPNLLLAWKPFPLQSSHYSSRMIKYSGGNSISKQHPSTLLFWRNFVPLHEHKRLLDTGSNFCICFWAQSCSAGYSKLLYLDWHTHSPNLRIVFQKHPKPRHCRETVHCLDRKLGHVAEMSLSASHGTFCCLSHCQEISQNTASDNTTQRTRAFLFSLNSFDTRTSPQVQNLLRQPTSTICLPNNFVPKKKSLDWHKPRTNHPQSANRLSNLLSLPSVHGVDNTQTIIDQTCKHVYARQTESD